MVKIDRVRHSVESHFHNRPLVAVFIGGTQGIGNFTINVLAHLYSLQENVPLRVYIVGRSRAKADRIITESKEIHKKGVFKFVQAADLALINDVDRTSQEILHLEREDHGQDNPRIDLLVLTQGQVLFGPRQDTDEGLDRSMSLLYYSRVRFTLNLMPLLQAAPQPHIVSVYAAGMEDKLFPKDLSLRQNYSFANCRSHVVHMKTMALEHLAQQCPTVGFAHIFPGLVVGPGFEDPSFPWWFKLIWRIFGPAVNMIIGVSPQDAGYRMLYAATDSFPARQHPSDQSSEPVEPQKGTDDIAGSGSYALRETDEVCANKVVYEELGRADFADAVWTHTMKAFEEIVAGRKYTD